VIESGGVFWAAVCSHDLRGAKAEEGAEQATPRLRACLVQLFFTSFSENLAVRRI
jgi:hypothetical protein